MPQYDKHYHRLNLAHCLTLTLYHTSCTAFLILFILFFFNDTATTEIYTLSLHDALPISAAVAGGRIPGPCRWRQRRYNGGRDRKSTRLNSSHSSISYAVFCLKKKKKISQRDSVKNNKPTTSISLLH